jgi:hypothetical protein
MKFLATAAAFCLLTLSDAAPAPAPTTNGVIVARDGNAASCTIHLPDLISWDFVVNAWGPWVDDWGQGFLDNLRGQCGEQILGWQFSYSGDEGTAQFTTSTFIRQHCVEDAIWLASNPTGAIDGVNCVVV